MTPAAGEPAASPRIALVSGANKGIGYETARRLARAGVTVALGARDAERGQQAAALLAQEGLAVHPCALEVTDAQSVAACASWLEQRFGGLDILVNNAGGGFFTCPPSALEPARLAAVLDLNVVSVLAVTRAMLPMLLRSASGRIVNVSSGTASLFMQSNPQWVGFGLNLSAYSISKTALNALTVQCAAELRGTRVKINAVEPGYTRTDLTGQQGFQTAEAAAAVLEKYALIGNDGPTGGFFDIHGPMIW